MNQEQFDKKMDEVYDILKELGYGRVVLCIGAHGRCFALSREGELSHLEKVGLIESCKVTLMFSPTN